MLKHIPSRTHIFSHSCVQERVEEQLFVRRQEQQQLDEMKQKMQDCQQLQKRLYDQVALENAMEDIRFLLGPEEKVSPEGIKRLAEWKVFGV